jgi:uncharacterized membrane protein
VNKYWDEVTFNTWFWLLNFFSSQDNQEVAVTVVKQMANEKSFMLDLPGGIQLQSFRVLIAIILAVGLASHGYFKKSLSATGAVSAFLVGLTSFASSYRFGFILILFYYTSSKLTKLQENVKAKLEDDYVSGGRRGAVQVLACSLFGTLACMLFTIWIGEDSHIDFGSSPNDSQLSIPFIKLSKNRAAAYLWSAYIAHYACATADTWASEVGILSKEKPRLVTTLREVPHGTNGGISVLGTFASMAGGAFIGIIFWAMSLKGFDNKIIQAPQYPMILVGLLSGFLGSLIDSVLGATVQATYYSTEKKCIVKKINSAESAKIDRVCGMNILSNEAVNIVSIVLTMIISIWLSPSVFCFCDSKHCSSS